MSTAPAVAPGDLRVVALLRLFVDLVGSDTRGVMGGVYGSRSPRIRSANH